MADLILLMLIPIIFIGILLVVSSNSLFIMLPKENHVLKPIILLEENNFKMPLVLQRYYSNIMDIKLNRFPFLKTTSFWHENTEIRKEEEIIKRKEYEKGLLRRIGLLLAITIYFLLFFYWMKFSNIENDFQVLSKIGPIDSLLNLDIILALDGLSFPFILLTGFIMPLVFISNWSTINFLDSYYVMIIIGLELFLIIVFMVIDLVMFYVFFESILPLLFVLIGIYGAAQKFRAGYYLFLYTLLGSLFMLLCFVKMGGDAGSSFFDTYTNEDLFPFMQEMIWIILFVSFSVKTPLVPVHIWLPLAHSDANVSGSIVLASIILKLALYGFLRILIGIFLLATARLTPFFLSMCTLSLLYSSFTTIRQFDLKVLVAYSSVAHMGSTLLGAFSNQISGLVGSVMFGLAHGFVSPGLFIGVGAVLYDRCGSRIINYYRGLSNILPLFTLLFLLLVFGNMGVPLTANFVGEFMSLIASYQQNVFITTLAALGIILSAIYSIFMYNRISTGSISPYIHTIPDLFRKEYIMLFILISATIFMGIYPTVISSEIEYGLSSLLYMNFIPLCWIGKTSL